MSLILVGTNHKYSLINIREKIAFSKKRLKDALVFLKNQDICKGAVILSTCNRVEIYASAGDEEEIKHFISRYHEVDKDEISPFLYTYKDEDVVKHLFLVTAGMDSMVLGETQILGQVRSAFSDALNAGFVDEFLKKIFYSAVSFAERVHKETILSRGKASIGSAAVDFLRAKIGTLIGKKILIIGVGKVTELVLRSLKKEESDIIFVSNRTYEKAKELAEKIGAEAVRFDELNRFLKEADIAITATGSPHFVIRKNNLEDGHKLVIMDLAVPRDVDPLVRKTKGVQLFCLEDLNRMERTYRIGTRASALALKQVEEVVGKISAEVVTIDTYGDKDKNTPISDIEGSDFFTREIDEALLKGNIDLAVHSAKDLPREVPEGLYVAVKTKCIDPYDVLVSKDNLKLNELPYGARIGTSSKRRKEQLKKYRKDFQIVDIRGNIEERLKKLDESDMDGIVIAAAGLIRLGLEHRLTQRIPFEILQPHPMQGRLAVVVREDDEDIIRLCRNIIYKKVENEIT